MRRFTFILLTAVFCPTIVCAWGLESYCITQGASGVEKGSICLADKFLAAGAAPCVGLTVESAYDKTDKANVESLVQKEFQAALDLWIRNIRGKIKSSGREEEFADFLKTFPQLVHLRLNQDSAKAKDPSCPNITITVTAENPNFHACAWAYPTKNAIDWQAFVYNKPLNNMGPGSINRSGRGCAWFPTEVLAHEIGHLFGLADLYEGQLESHADSHEMDKQFSLVPMNISSKQMEPFSIMTNLGDQRPQMGCDDVDAIVNMADILAAKKGKVSPRIQNGWNSFCPAYSSFKYAYGQPYRNDKEYQDNKKRLDAIMLFENSYFSWKQEAKRVDDEIKKLEAELEKAERPLKTQDLMISARINYLRDRSKQIAGIQGNFVENVDYAKDWLGEYDRITKLLQDNKGIAPGSELYDMAVLGNYTPENSALEDFIPKQKHKCIVCGKEIESGENQRTASSKRVKKSQNGKIIGTYYTNHVIYYHNDCDVNSKDRMTFAAYAQKYGYDNEARQRQNQLKAKPLTYTQLAIKRGMDPKRSPSALDLSASLALSNTVSLGGVNKPAVSSSIPQVSSGSLAMGGGASHQPARQTSVPTVTANTVAPRPQSKHTTKQAVSTNNKAALDQFIASHPTLERSIQKVKSGTATPQDRQEVAQYQALYSEYQGAKTGYQVPSSSGLNGALASAGKGNRSAETAVTDPSARPALKPSTPQTSQKTAPPNKPAAQPADKPAELVCSVCGKKIANEDDAYIPPEKARGPVHKHSECAYKYFSRFYSVDNSSLDRYNQSYFFSKEPADVTAAKGLMKKLGLTPAEAKSYASSSREAYRAQEQKRQQQQQEEAAAKQKRQQDAKKCSSYAVVTADDVKAFETANRASFAAIARREKAGKKLTEKQKRLKRLLAQLKADKVRTDYCQKVK